MSLHIKLVILTALLVTSAYAQKTTVGYDKSADFSRYKTYTWSEPAMPPSRPLLYASILASVDHLLQSKGLMKVEKDGDMVLVPAGGMEFGLNTAGAAPIIPSYTSQPPSIDSTMWTGSGSSNLMAPYVPEGTLMLTFVNREGNKVVWSGTVTLKLDMEQKRKSLDLVDKAIAKLLKAFPPDKK